jgi:hypothetical protein
MPSTDTKLELTAKASMAQPVSQPAVYANGLIAELEMLNYVKAQRYRFQFHDNNNGYFILFHIDIKS